MFNGEDIGTMRIRTRSDISPRSRQMKGARAYGTNPALTPKLARPFRVAEAPGAASHWQIRRRRLASRYAAIYAAAFSTGAVVMGIAKFGLHFLTPNFGSGIYTCAALISTVLVALMAGYFLGGTLADRTPSTVVLALTVIIGSLYLLALPIFAHVILEFVLAEIDDVRVEVGF